VREERERKPLSLLPPSLVELGGRRKDYPFSPNESGQPEKERGGEQEARRPSRTGDDSNTELSTDAKLRVLTC